MKVIAKLILRAVGIGRTAPETGVGASCFWTARVVCVVALGMISLHAFPQLLFPHSVSHMGITMYSPNPLPSGAADVIRIAAGLVQASELAIPERKERVFVSAERWRAWLFKPYSGSFAFSVSLTDNVFVSEANIDLNVSRSSESGIGHRTLSSVIAHEITHGLVRERLGVVSAARLPVWVSEGYCDYVSGESSFATDDGRRLLVAGQSHSSHSFQYFVYREMVRHLIEDRGLKFDQVVALSDQYERVRAEAVEALKGRIQ